MINILYIEDNPDNVFLMEEMLVDQKHIACSLIHAGLLATGLERLGKGGVDIILLDLSLPDSHGFSTFQAVKELAIGLPIIIMTSLVDETLAMASVQEGAQDYLIKGQVDANVLMRAIRYAIERVKFNERLEEIVAERTAELSSANSRLNIELEERKRAEEENTKLQAQLQQAQRMESVGRLAGGVAHDYNNMLGIILGYTQMALEKTDPLSPLYEDLQETLEAAQRSAGITRQLLTFARKQTIAPQVLDLNETVEGMLKMLRRLIGEDVSLSWFPAPNLWPVNIDPSQVNQILANLCVNARDAIADVGNITIGTGAVTFEPEYSARQAGLIPGDYVLLVICDDGCGMEKEVVDMIFEPFFTTKDVGHGTGLGLSTVYGIVQQNNGFINVYSESGKGTTFRIYLPRHTGEINKPEKQSNEAIQRGHGETVLVVEDEEKILRLTGKMLMALGYTVLTANRPKEAIGLAHAHANGIHLLLTDVIMPEMNGRDLAELLLTANPGLKCLFMSGYTASIIAGQGALNERAPLIQKPFSARDLAAKVHEVMGSNKKWTPNMVIKP